MDINVNDQVTVNQGAYDGDVGTVTHIRDVDDSGATYRLLRTEDDWFLGWFTADQLTALDQDEIQDDVQDEIQDETGPEDEAVNDA